MRGRHAAELTHATAPGDHGTDCAPGARASGARRRLEARDVRRGLAAIRSRLAAADTPAARTAAPRRTSATAARFRALAGRLEMPQPARRARARLRGLLERGSHGDHPSGASRSPPGDRGAAVTLHEGEIRLRSAQCPWIRPLRTSNRPSPSSRPSSRQIEEGDLALEKSLELFERGVQLSRFCHAQARGSGAAHRDPQRARRAQAGAAGAGPDAGRRGRQGPVTHRGRAATPGSTRSRALVDAGARALPAGTASAAPAVVPRRCATACSPAASACARCWRSPPPKPSRTRPASRTRCRDALALPAACALELIHTYSLVHDDLPAMDDDTLRRGRPTAHVGLRRRHGDSAGDGLLTEAFALLAREPADGIAAVDRRRAGAAQARRRSRSSPTPPARRDGRRPGPRSAGGRTRRGAARRGRRCARCTRARPAR